MTPFPDSHLETFWGFSTYVWFLIVIGLGFLCALTVFVLGCGLLLPLF